MKKILIIIPLFLGGFLFSQKKPVKKPKTAAEKFNYHEEFKKISDEKEHVVFLLWGGFAKKKGAKIDRNKHFVLETGHPSPLSANRGFWFGNKHFSATNSLLKSKNFKEIES